ncbi:DUF2490 domain-containing protein [Flagellimonas meridianipacifica]|uniref:Uncharacterized protein DUF2490 n=1 Tax=Flagellimonas meridianipacifica TaxID=1080225 RepID=A0A2T0MG76_9FLAO|nr:DUF2490 domain-containing protein [Allomuricauda pacifica]PRX56572.1 uncharacterized protein DUF2490 [Allomuricauda pacifica]
MSFIRVLGIGTCLVLSITLNAQENVTGFWQPQAAIDYDVSPTYGHNFSVAYRSFFLEDENFGLTSRQLDLVHFSKLVLKENQSVALGIQYRFRDIFENASNELRLTQQYNFKYRPFTIRYGHRFRSEQRITTNLTTHRFRYRFAIDFPLKGQKLNLGEPYLVGSAEQLLSVAKGESSQYDFRLNGQIGWQLDKEFKLQIGMEYRFEEYTAPQIQHVIFLLTTVQLSL